MRHLLIYILLFSTVLSSSPVWAASKHGGAKSHKTYASVHKKAAIVLDAKTGKVLYAQNADIQVYPASLTKLMTLYLTFDAIKKGYAKPTDKITVSKKAANMAPSKLGLDAGQRVMLHDAVLGIVTKSANDAAAAVGENLGGDETKFASMMTNVARKIGMAQTTFKNASGLPNKEQKTTAHDMAVLAMALINHFPEYYHLFSTENFDFEGKTFTNHNRLLGYYDGIDGLKTGYTNASGYNIVTSAKRGNDRVIAVVFGQDSAKKRNALACKLMDQGFNKIAMTKGHKTVSNNRLRNPVEIEDNVDETETAGVRNQGDE